MTFVGDRFVTLGPGHRWLDVLTGRPARVRVGPAPAGRDGRARRAEWCRERWAMFENGTELLDFGSQGIAGWFEAESDAPLTVPVPHRRLLWPQIAELARGIGDGSVDGHVSVFAPPGAGFRAMTTQLARTAREWGFVTIRADASIPFRLRRHLLHRHVILLVPNERARAFAAGWVAQLALASDRRHVVIERLECADAARVCLRPFSPEALMEIVRPADRADLPGPALVDAARQSGGWPAAFIRALSPSRALNVVRERALVYASAPPAVITRDLARAATCARRRRPAAESQWHAAAVAAAERRGDVEIAARATTAWVERLIEERRFSRAIAVATQALAKQDSAAWPELTVSAARAHLMAAHVARAATLAASVIETDRLAGRPVSVSAVCIELEALFWQGRWAELRARLDAQVDAPHREAWTDLLAWADRTDAAANGPEDVLDSRGPCPPWRGEPGLARAVAIALRRSAGVSQPADDAWLNELVRRERLRGLARFEQGTSEMQMLRDMTTLLEIVQTSDDERAGLARLGDWLRQAAGATATAIVTTKGDLVAGDGPPALGVEPHEVARWCESADAALFGRGARGVAYAPVRCGGEVLGTVIAVGPERCGRPMLDAVQAVAAVSGPLVRCRLDALAASSSGDALANDILGTSPAICGVRAAVARVALAPFSVVIEGESGTGKELVARALHRQSARRERAFAALNCAALTDELVDAELFGHTRGAFTHAVTARVGLFEEAHHGTLFLDEVGDLSPRAQAKLLRALQEGEIRRVGENDARAVDVRVIAATNRPLATLAADGRFREDLMFRLAVVRIAVPPLRDRAEDVPQLALAFWRIAARRVGTRAQLGPDALALLAQLPWPGNVRQLQNAMAALSVAAPRLGRVGARLVRLVVDGLGEAGELEVVRLDDARRDAERRVIAAAMTRHVGNRAEAARALGLSRQGLAKALRRLGLAQAGAA